jgi:hypothetical protein
MKPKTFKNAEEFTRYIAHVTGKPFKAAASTDGTTAHKYLSGQRDYAKLFTDPDLMQSWMTNIQTAVCSMFSRTIRAWCASHQSQTNKH